MIPTLMGRSSHSPPSPKYREGGDIKQQPAKPPQTARIPVTEIFLGKTVTSVKCLSCGQVSTRQEVFWDLSLPITGGRSSRSITLVQHSPCARSTSLRWPTFLQRSLPSTPTSSSKSRTRGRSTNSTSWSLVGPAQPLKGAAAVGRHVFSHLTRGSVALFAALFFYVLLAFSWRQSYKENDIRKYVEAAKELKQLERSTLSVNFEDLLMHDSRLASLIEDEYYRYINLYYIIHRLYPFLCNAVKNFINDHVPDTLNSGRDFYVSFTDISTLNNLEVLLRADAVELAQPGDRCEFIGTLIVVPDVGQLATPAALDYVTDSAPPRMTIRGSRPGQLNPFSSPTTDAEYRRSKNKFHVPMNCVEPGFELTPLRRIQLDLESYLPSDDLESADGISYEAMSRRLSPAELDKICQMSQDKHLFNNLCGSLFPTIHGSEEVKKGILLMLFGGVPKTVLIAPLLQMTDPGKRPNVLLSSDFIVD
ncbi:unnamed protein product [Schistocephalus solidus]|uniref:DNA helicase n=1 Tax=Schistocephalus solidus TaxID=70667 RepID=A0A183T6M5_SCHSO|nr:unnamed protein product [Schistocephalus solidus]